MKNLKTFEGFFSKIKKSILEDSYLVKYTVTNYKLKDEFDTDLSDNKESNLYEYIISARSIDDARTKFNELWNKTANSLEPTPRLNIISVGITPKERQRKNQMKGMNSTWDGWYDSDSFRNELKFY